MNLLFLNGYNNYFNRRLKKENSIEDYINGYNYEIRTEVNFNPNDGVKTTIVLNYDGSYLPDYLVVFDEYNLIVSRWFIMDMQRTRNGQYQIRLQRDLIADFYESIRELPVFVQRGNLSANNPLIYNSEGMYFNQIKKTEFILKDATKSAWIVGYVDRKTLETTTIEVNDGEGGSLVLEDLPIKLTSSSDPSLGASLKYSFGHQYICSVKQNISLSTPNIWEFIVEYSNDSPTPRRVNANLNSYGNNKIIFAQAKIGKWPDASGAEEEAQIFKEALKSSKLNLNLSRMQFLEANDLDYVDKVELDTIKSLDGLIVYSTIAQKYYVLNIIDTINKNVVYDIDSSNYPALWTSLNKTATDFITASKRWQKVSDPKYQIKENYSELIISLVPTLGPGSRKVTLNVNHNHLSDAPYDMFCMKYTPNNLNLASSIVNQLGTKLYDIQILPYCPAIFLMTGAGIEPELMGEEDLDYNVIESDEGPDYLIWCKKSSQSFIINKGIRAEDSAIDIKVANECDLYRLCSPNYNGVFEFNAAKNNGVEYFNVYLTYKPFSPYIQVAPNFKNLYGSSFYDARGLICNGDFSIAMTSDAWTQYEINNKNYQNIFNTQIKTMDSLHEIDRTNIIASAITGTFQGASSGAIGGGIVGGPWGAAIGAGVGGVLSAAGGVMDYQLQEKSYQLNRQQTFDLWNYNLQNVRALPTSLNKVSAYTINNKLFPFVEYYTCTDAEKDALKRKIKYNGMSVGAIGTIAEYEGRVDEFNFFKGQLIQTSTLTDDYHIADSLAAELERGIYLN